MACTAGHAMGLATSFLNGMPDLRHQERIHRHGMLGKERPPPQGHTAARGHRVGLANQLVQSFSSRTI